MDSWKNRLKVQLVSSPQVGRWQVWKCVQILQYPLIAIATL